jgi:hypothetical protein
MQVFVTLYSHRHGIDVSAYASRDLAEAARLDTAISNWAQEFPGEEPPADLEELAEEYFARMAERFGGEESFEIEECSVNGA